MQKRPTQSPEIIENTDSQIVFVILRQQLPWLPLDERWYAQDMFLLNL